LKGCWGILFNVTSEKVIDNILKLKKKSGCNVPLKTKNDLEKWMEDPQIFASPPVVKWVANQDFAQQKLSMKMFFANKLMNTKQKI